MKEGAESCKKSVLEAKKRKRKKRGKKKEKLVMESDFVVSSSSR